MYDLALFYADSEYEGFHFAIFPLKYPEVYDKDWDPRKVDRYFNRDPTTDLW